ncbi:hypothetical protein DRW03_14890 [Corallococcus sp. H22C18031201]|nr:hypothetical protein DRW03_14890 [Corallococcus sp. H22C18031201]
MPRCSNHAGALGVFCVMWSPTSPMRLGPQCVGRTFSSRSQRQAITVWKYGASVSPTGFQAP